MNQLIKDIFRNVSKWMNVMVRYNFKDFILIFKVWFLVINAMNPERFLLLELKFKMTTLYLYKNSDIPLPLESFSINRKNKKQLNV